jgi:hypothetical protein
MKEYLDFIKTTGDYLRTSYVEGDGAEYWDKVKDSWKDDCERLPHAAIDLACNILNSIHQDIIKNRVIEMTGLDFEEDLLLLDKKGFLCSLFEKKLQIMARRITSSDCKLKLKKVAKNLHIVLADKHGEIIPIQIPFTLQKNGAWYLPKDPYKGERYHGKEKASLSYGQRRPKKSKEMSTSINTYLPLGKALEWGEDAV